MIDKRLMKPIQHKQKHFTLWSLQGAFLALTAAAQAILLAQIIHGVFMVHWSWSQIWPTLMLLIIVLILRPSAQLIQDFYSKNLALKSKHRIRQQLYKRTQMDSGQSLVTKSSGFLSFLGIEAVEQTDAYYSEFMPHLFLVAINTLIILVAAVSQDPLSALLMVVTAPLIPVFMILIGKNSEGHQQKQWLSLKLMNGHLLDVLRGIVTLRHFGKDQSQTQIVYSISEAYRKKTMRLLAMTFISAFALELTATLATAVIAVSLGIRLLYGQIEFLPALTVLLLAPEYFQPLRALGLKYHAALNGKTAAHSIFNDYIDTALEPIDSNHIAPSAISESFASNPILIQNLSLQYDKEAPLLFEPVTLTIQPGDAVALIGPSGIGKTSFIKALLGLIPTATGTTTLDSMTKEERMAFMAYVPQRSTLFRGTVLDNLRFGNPSLSKEHVVETCKRFSLHDFITALPEGYDTMVGSEGKSLSGGQTQLIALMRAWLRGTPIILMDEPTSAMDVQTENDLLQALHIMRSERTLIISAHRQQILSLCNKTLELQEVSHS